MTTIDKRSLLELKPQKQYVLMCSYWTRHVNIHRAWWPLSAFPILYTEHHGVSHHIWVRKERIHWCLLLSGFRISKHAAADLRCLHLQHECKYVNMMLGEKKKKRFEVSLVLREMKRGEKKSTFIFSNCFCEKKYFSILVFIYSFIIVRHTHTQQTHHITIM